MIYDLRCTIYEKRLSSDNNGLSVEELSTDSWSGLNGLRTDYAVLY